MNRHIIHRLTTPGANQHLYRCLKCDFVCTISSTDISGTHESVELEQPGTLMFWNSELNCINKCVMSDKEYRMRELLK